MNKMTYGLSFAQSALRVRYAGDKPVKTFVADYDLNQPAVKLDGLSGYQQLLILIRDRGKPLGLLMLKHDPEVICVSSKAIFAELEKTGMLDDATENNFQCDADTDPGISVVVCTRDRPELLWHCLTALRKLDYENFEVIVVDNASRGRETKKMVAATPFRYVREDTPGLDWARNRGVAEACFDIIAYTDDDVQVDSGWLKGIARALSNSEVDAVTGLVLPLELETAAQHYFQAYGNGMCRGFERKYYQISCMTTAELLATQNLGVGANMAFRRTVLKQLGGFDTALDVGTPAAGGGDLDMFHRVLITGRKLCYEPEALVWHRHRRHLIELKRQLHSHGCSYGVYLLKRWHEGRINQFQILRFAGSHWLSWLLGRLVLGLLGHHRLPMSLLWAELWGALLAPKAYVATYQRDKTMKSRHLII